MAFVTSGFGDEETYNADSIDDRIRTAMISSSESVPSNTDDYNYSILQVDTRLALKSDTSHNHNDSYNTKAEITASLALKSEVDHTHEVPIVVHNSHYTTLSTNEEVWLRPDYETYILTACDDDPILYAINTSNYGSIGSGTEFTFLNSSSQTITILLQELI